MVETRSRRKKNRTPVYMNFVSEGVLSMDDSAKKISKMTVLSVKDEAVIAKKMRRSNIIYMIVIGICIAMIATGVAMEAWYILDVSKTASSLAKISDDYTSSVNGTGDEGEGLDEENTAMLPPIVDFAGLKSVNQDAVAWIKIPGTSVDYPVLKSSWQDQYLNTDLYGEYSIAGSIFLDFENSGDCESDSHVIIYGHHMVAPIMFHDVSFYDDYGFFLEHRTAYLETEEKTYKLKAIGSYIAEPSEYMVRQAQFGNEEDFQLYLDDRINRCDLIYEGGENRKTMDKLVTLVTCTATGASRLVVEFAVENEFPTEDIPRVILHELSKNE